MITANTVFAIYQIIALENIHSGVNIIMNPTTSPTQGQQPNPRKKLGQMWHLGHFFPQQINLSWVGIGFK